MIHINDEGTLRHITRIHINDNGVLREIEDIDVSSFGNLRKVFDQSTVYWGLNSNPTGNPQYLSEVDIIEIFTNIDVVWHIPDLNVSGFPVVVDSVTSNSITLQYIPPNEEEDSYITFDVIVNQSDAFSVTLGYIFEDGGEEV